MKSGYRMFVWMLSFMLLLQLVLPKISYIEIAAAAADTAPPSVPQNLRGGDIAQDSLTLLWDASTDNGAVKGYRIYRDGERVATVAESVYYSDAGLQSGRVYTYTVTAFDHADNESVKSEALTVAAAGNGSGLKAEYYNDTDFSELRFIRLDETVNFNWGGEKPDPLLNRDDFSVRWSGKVTANYSEVYTFHTETHGGGRLWVDGQLLFEEWDKKGMVKQNASVSITAGQTYDIVMEFMDDSGSAQARLYWSSLSQIKQIIPRSQLNPPYIPEPPANIQLSESSTAMMLSWDAVEGASGYDVEADGVVIGNGTNTTFVHDNLAPNSDHVYRVRAKVPEIAGNWSSPLAGTTKLGVPGNVAAMVEDYAITVSWDTVSGAAGYDIEADGKVIDNGAATAYVHTGLMPDTEHTYRVRAKNGASAGDWTELVVRTVLPTIPGNIQTDITSTSITLMWDEVPNATGYDIEIDGAVVGNGSGRSYVHDGLKPNTMHMYRIRAIKSNGPGEWSVYVTATTFPEPGTGTGLTGEYYAGEHLTELKTARVDRQINFQWDNSAPAEGVDNDTFSVRWTGQIEPRFSEDYTFTAEAHGGIRLWIDGTLLADDWQAHNMSTQSAAVQLQAGKKYDIQMEYREVNGEAEAHLYWESDSQPREAVPQSQLYPIGVPQQLTAAAEETIVTLQWDEVSFAAGYEVEVDGVVVDNGTSLTFTHEDLMPGTLHTYRVRAKNSIVTGEWSSMLTQATLLGQTAINSLEATETTVTVSWEPVYGATGYIIEADGTLYNNGSSTIFEHRELLSGTEHVYRVRPRTAAVTGDWTPLEAKWTLPGVPENIRLQATSDSIRLEWDKVRGAVSYEIETDNTIVNNGSSSIYTEENLNPNLQRTFRIRAINTSGTGKWSELVAKSTLPGTAGALYAAATDTSIRVTWDAVSGAQWYDLEVDGVPERVVGTQYVHVGLQPNTKHSYRIRSGNSEGMSSYSELVSAVTLPSVPGNVRAAVGNDRIQIEWNAVSGSTGYDVEVDGVIQSNGTSTNYIHQSLAPSSEHTYRVRAKNGSIFGQWTGTLTRTTLSDMPVNLSTMATGTEITLAWDPVIGANGYDVEVDGQILNNGLEISYVHAGLHPYTEHTYRVRARNVGGAGPWSGMVRAVTTLGEPSNIQLVSTADSITIRWDPVPGAASYEVAADGITTDIGNETRFIHRGLTPASWHVYRIRAKNTDVTGVWSPALTKETILGIPVITHALASSDSISLKWDPVVGADSYEIEVDGTVLSTGAATEYVHSSLTSGSDHTYRVRAKNGTAAGNWSDEITRMTSPNVPQFLSAAAKTDSISLTWTPISGSSGYDLEIDGEVVSGITGSRYIHSALKANTMHVYRVRSESGGQVSPWSEPLEKKTVSELIANPGKDNMFNFVVVAPPKEGASEQMITVTYDSEAVEVLDLSAVTPVVELAAGQIQKAGMTIVSFAPGEIVIRIHDASKTFVNGIRLLAKTNNPTKITFTVE